MSQKPFVLAIAGTSGAGKSTIVSLLGQALAEAAILRFDEYENEDTYPRDVHVFLKRGCPVNDIKSARFEADIKAWCAGHAVIPPHTEIAVKPAKILILDEPTGRCRDVMRPLIDYVICLDIPYEMAMARRIMRTIEIGPDDHAAVQAIRDEVGWFMEFGHVVYRTIGEQVVAQADTLVDALQAPEAIIDQIMTTLRTLNVISTR